ncbi:hypothetical protein ACIRJS_27295 [Streptomyces sp. NPDC102340]|uniref:hypothetical protein n=1 Tax=unclassified Streptomyces TaxID=2593676 RepID=UPI003826DD81
MSVSEPDLRVGVQPVAPASAPPSRLSAGEAAVVVTAIAAVTVLAALERPVPAVLTALVAGVGLLLVPGRAADLIGVLVGSR